MGSYIKRKCDGQGLTLRGNNCLTFQRERLVVILTFMVMVLDICQ